LFVPVQINKNKIYWFFGARFEMRGWNYVWRWKIL
jgi:hypothetical protein